MLQSGKCLLDTRSASATFFLQIQIYKEKKIYFAKIYEEKNIRIFLLTT